MKNSFSYASLLVCLLAASSACAGEQFERPPKVFLLGEPDDSILRQLPDWTFTTKAYQEEALRVLLEEVNVVARELNLPETLPITRSNLIEATITPPALAMVGNVATTNYFYAASVGKRFSNMTIWNHGPSFDPVKAKYTWPISRMDTNKAFKVAMEIMAAVRMDVAGLNRDCSVEISAPVLEEFRGQFIPDYWVNWRKEGKTVAYVEFVEPTRTIRQLSVKDPKYILREPIRVPNLAQLLNQTNFVFQTNQLAKP